MGSSRKNNVANPSLIGPGLLGVTFLFFLLFSPGSEIGKKESIFFLFFHFVSLHQTKEIQHNLASFHKHVHCHVHIHTGKYMIMKKIINMSIVMSTYTQTST